MLSNRTPTDVELIDGHKVLKQMLDLGQFQTVVAVGRKSAQQLAELGIDVLEVRHPANGGAGKFRDQMNEIVGSI